jgi:phage gp46-like protein
VRQSYVIEIDGVFVGAAAFYGDSYRFVGVHSRLKELDGQRFSDLSQVKEAASRTYRLAPLTTSIKTNNIAVLAA